jgi:hypothetical protein
MKRLAFYLAASLNPLWDSASCYYANESSGHRNADGEVLTATPLSRSTMVGWDCRWVGVYEGGGQLWDGVCQGVFGFVSDAVRVGEAGGGIDV